MIDAAVIISFFSMIGLFVNILVLSHIFTVINKIERLENHVYGTDSHE